KALQDGADLWVGYGFSQVNEEIWRAQIAVVLDDFIFENQMVPERVPSQLRHEPMVLMQVPAVVSQDDVRKVFSLEVLEEILDFGAHIGEIAVPKFLDDDLLSSCVRQKEIGALKGLGSSPAGCPHHNPVNLRSRVFVQPPEDRAPTTDFDVVAVCPQAQDLGNRSSEV